MLKGLYITDVNNQTIPSDAINLVNNTELDLREVDGLGRPDAELYTQEKVAVDASFYSGQTVKSRTITLSVKTKNDLYRMVLYRMLGYNDKRRIFVETDAGVYWIDGYVKGATYAAKPAARQEIEIPIFCPYPWFRSARRHKRLVMLNKRNTVYDCCNNGDIQAGIQIYSTEGSDLMVRNLFASAGNNTVKFSTAIPTFYTEQTLLDTTPGNHTIAGGWRGVSPSDITITGGMPVLNPGVSQLIEVEVTADGANPIESIENAECLLSWYDTWSGI